MNAPALRLAESAAARPFRHVLLATDFAATTDAFHRRLLALARSRGERVSVLHLPVEGAPDDPCASILVDGLLARLQIDPAVAWVAGHETLHDAFHACVKAHGVDLVIAGRCSALPEHAPCRRLPGLAAQLGCTLIALEDSPEWL